MKNHDTIGMLAIDNSNNLSGGVSTSGMAWKIHGRVGDSPIIGAAMFVDNESAVRLQPKRRVVMRTVGSFLIVKKCVTVFHRKRRASLLSREFTKRKEQQDIQIGYLALNKKGEIGAFSLYDGFTYALTSAQESKVMKSEF